MTDVLSYISSEKVQLGKKYAKQLLKEVRPYVYNGKIAELANYGIHDVPTDYDPSALEALVQSELERHAVKAVNGYTDWIATRLVKTGDNTVPAPSEIPYGELMSRYDLNMTVLQKVVTYMHAQRNLPLVGKVSKGKFHPDKDIFEQWKDMFDWSK